MTQFGETAIAEPGQYLPVPQSVEHPYEDDGVLGPSGVLGPNSTMTNATNSTEPIPPSGQQGGAQNNQQ